MPSDNANIISTDKLPIEVELIKQVKNCRTCGWFWGATPPYGPFPAFDWIDEFPESVKNPPAQTEDDEPIQWSEVESVGDQLVEPAVLRGCRKAPIMTVGINPNMTPYFAGAKSATWAYPYFKRDSSYAYYYRHATIFQESFDLAAIKDFIIEGTEVYAERDGFIAPRSAKRGSSHRWMEVGIQYHDEDQPHYHEMTWLPEERAVVLAQGDVKQGDIIAAKIQTPKDASLDLYANGTGYYQRLLPALKRLGDYLGVGDKPLTMGEDVSMHDMVGCASPGWSSSYDIPLARIADNCVNQQQFMMDQLLQSNPAVVMVVSNSSLTMFADGFKALGGEIDLDYADRDVYDLLKETSARCCYLTLRTDKVDFKARLLITPHFSYSDNFATQSRLSTKAWEAFMSEYHLDVDVLEKNKRIKPATFNGYVPIDLSGPDDTIKQQLSVAGWQVLMGHFYDPYQLMTDMFIDELQQGHLVYDRDQGHLARAAGGCQFCVNERWQFPEGCEYGIATPVES